MKLFKKGSDDGAIEETVAEVQSEQELTRAERKALKKSKKKKGKFTETIEDDYDESDRTLLDSDAHRDVVYELPSTAKQIWICYMTQMKRFTKERTIWALLILLAFIPLVYRGMARLLSSMGSESSNVINIFISMPLMGMPVIVMFICANVCGSMLPREYNERTVYLTLPLPLSRFAFYIGKFLAGLTLVWGVITAAYGISILLALFSGNADVAYSSPMFTSLMIILGSSFFFCSFVYMLSATSKRGAAMKSMLILIIGLPLLIVIASVLPNLESMSSFKGVLKPLADALVYLPVLGPDLALSYLGLSPISLMIGINWVSLTAFVNGLSMGFVSIEYSMNAYLMTLVAVGLGILCLIRGFLKIKRRDM